mmetsp:Transcript_36882/g.51226  ORF Transcript_36882/g.51226 Transcript_36882/m.51226 type:complete len:232 (-) Transcript_36882:154-849(-)|eukprot:CAMPEP_0196586972 /NCGR_PEP_ID=MMETSP1081-20130531/56063_1 /TAXON_ID=36882 /ORGANISM="Pyramimonas amylifera, Strain CCMP720" /LENGTH=231 /DNA_ID=CAMNT_0041909009 /DNA_START=56 /DNA_END=751 /DNA_ORIENTATION=+
MACKMLSKTSTTLTLGGNQGSLSSRTTLHSFYSPSKKTTFGRSQLQIVNLSSNDIKNGMSIEIDGAPYKVVEFLHVKPGKGSAFVRTKVKNYLTGNSVDKTFRAGEPIQAADMEKSVMQFTYMDGDDYVFMDMNTYDETRLKEDDWAKYLVEGTEVDILTWNSKVVGVQPPSNMVIEVVDCDPGVKGNTVQGGTKPAQLASGASVMVPLFINIGDNIEVDTRTDSYLRRIT